MIFSSTFLSFWTIPNFSFLFLFISGAIKPVTHLVSHSFSVFAFLLSVQRRVLIPRCMHGSLCTCINTREVRILCEKTVFTVQSSNFRKLFPHWKFYLGCTMHFFEELCDCFFFTSEKTWLKEKLFMLKRKTIYPEKKNMGGYRYLVSGGIISNWKWQEIIR